MDEGRINRALARIASAFNRVENAATAAQQREANGGPRDAAFRQRVGSALVQLDELIAEIER